MNIRMVLETSYLNVQIYKRTELETRCSLYCCKFEVGKNVTAVQMGKFITRFCDGKSMLGVPISKSTGVRASACMPYLMQTLCTVYLLSYFEFYIFRLMCGINSRNIFQVNLFSYFRFDLEAIHTVRLAFEGTFSGGYRAWEHHEDSDSLNSCYICSPHF